MKKMSGCSPHPSPSLCSFSPWVLNMGGKGAYDGGCDGGSLELLGKETKHRESWTQRNLTHLPSSSGPLRSNLFNGRLSR